MSSNDAIQQFPLSYDATIIIIINNGYLGICVIQCLWRAFEPSNSFSGALDNARSALLAGQEYHGYVQKYKLELV